MRLTPPSLPHSTGAGHCQGRPGVHFSLDSALLLCYLLQSDISLGRAERKLANIYLTHTVIWNVIDTIDFIQDLEYNYVNIVDIVGDPVADGICQKRVRQLLQPSLNVRLRTEDRGVSLVTGLHDFQ